MIRVISGAAIGIGLGGVVGVIGAAVRVAGSRGNRGSG